MAKETAEPAKPDEEQDPEAAPEDVEDATNAAEETSRPTKARKRFSFRIPRALTQPIDPVAFVRVTSTVANRELGDLARNPLVYAFTALFLSASGLYLFVIHDFFGSNEATIRPLVRVLPLFLAALLPILTMRSIADERASGTLAWLQTLPVTNAQVVMGKYLAFVVVLTGVLGLTLVFPLLVGQIGDLDSGETLAGFVGLVFVGGAYGSIGIWASSIANKSGSAFVLALVGGLLFYGLSTAVGLVSVEGAELLSYASFREHFYTMERGVLDSRNLVFYASVVLVALTSATQSLGRDQRESHLGAAGCVILSLVMAAGLNVAGSAYYSRIDLTQNRVNTLADASREAITDLHQVDVALYMSPDLPGVLQEATTGETIDTTAVSQRLRDVLGEFQASSNQGMRVRIITSDLERVAIEAGMQPLEARGREHPYFLGLTLTYGDVVERLPSAMFPEHHEYEITRMLLRLRRRAYGFKPMKELRSTVKTVHKSALKCYRALARSTTPLNQLPPAKRQEPTLSKLRFSEYKFGLANIKGKCHWLEELSRAMSVHEGKNRTLNTMSQSSARAARELRNLAASLEARSPDARKALGQVARIKVDLERVIHAFSDFEAAPGRKTVGIVCGGTSLCPFPSQSRFSSEERGQVAQEVGRFRSLGRKVLALNDELNLQLERVGDAFFRHGGAGVKPVDLKTGVPAHLRALVIFAPVGPSPAYSTSGTHRLDNFSQIELYHLDQFLMGGGTVAVFLNPWDVTLVPQSEDDKAGAGATTKNASNIGKLLTHYGIEPTGNLLISPRKHGDLRMKLRVKKQGITSSLDSVGYPLFPRLTALDESHTTLRSIHHLTLPWVTTLRLTNEQAKPLVLSTRNPVTRPANVLPLDPQSLWRWAQDAQATQGDPVAVVALREGRFESYFKTPPETAEGPDFGPHAATGKGRLLVVGSSLGLKPLHADTIISPGLSLAGIAANPGPVEAELSTATKRLHQWRAAMDQQQPQLASEWSETRVFLRTVLDWMVEEEPLRDIDPKILRPKRLDINPHKDHGWPGKIRAFAIGSGPAFLLIIALMSWLLRRRRRRWIPGALQSSQHPQRLTKTASTPSQAPAEGLASSPEEEGRVLRRDDPLRDTDEVPMVLPSDVADPEDAT